MTDKEDPRTRRFFEWRSSAETTTPGETVGKGNYGTVYRCGDGAVVKVVSGVRKSAGSAKLAYREHVMSLLQTVLVLRRHTPHLPIHYGLETAHEKKPKSLSMKLYIEAFDCSLDAAPPECLLRPQDWVGVLFQVSSAVLCVAKLLDVCHNDLYPRNVLVRRLGTRQMCRYDHFGVRHALRSTWLAALTDFGVCSSPLLASRSGPEVKRSPAIPRSAVPFGQQPPGVHVLNHTYLPQFSRDPYTLFKWGAFRTKGLPRSPKEVVSWCQSVLEHLDRHQADFTRPAATLRLFEVAFSPAVLQAHGLSPLFEDKDEDDTALDFSVADSDKGPVIEDCTALLSSVPFSP